MECIANTRIPVQCFSTAATVTPDDGIVTTRLNELIDRGEVRYDSHQLDAALELDRIYDHLLTHDPPPLQPSTKNTTASAASDGSFFGGFFGGNNPSSADGTGLTTTSSSSFLQGAYLYGGVGCGKTFLMNILHDAIDSGPWAKDKQKVHYHKFMLDVHQHMHQQRKLDPQGDLIAPVVDQVARQGRLLFLDEFQVTDVADALILQRLFEGLWQQGCILVATSNRPPSDLYLNGIQRDRFLPFIERLEQECAVVDLLDSETDYRMLSHSAPVTNDSQDNHDENNKATKEAQPVYFTKGQSKDFRKFFYRLTEGHPANPMALSTQGRRVPIPLASTHKRVAHFEFSDLCQKALGAADYLVIAQNFSTVFCKNIPKLTIHEVNWLRRFITFVDTMYEMKVKLVLHTQAKSVDEIFVVEGDKSAYSQDEVFAFDRTRSRLEEMSSPKYLQSQWLGKNRSNNDVERRITLHPSLDNHHQGPALAETSRVLEDQATSNQCGRLSKVRLGYSSNH